jgi:hypothetical protein
MIWLQLGVWLVMFCDEINLPDMDAYGTQRVISFLRQMVEHNGFYRSAVLRIQIRDPGWVKKSRSGSGMNNPDHISESLETIFWG